MADETSHDNVSYERKDIHLRVVLGLLAVAACFLVVVLLTIRWFYWAEEDAQQAVKGSTAKLAPLYPAEPRLEQIDRLADVGYVDITKRLATQEKQLNSHGPTDEKGFVHIPIQQAIEAVADKLPVRKQPAAAENPNSGQMIGGQR